MLGLVAREEGDHVGAARLWLAALTAPGQPWFDEDDYSTSQYAASILADPGTAAVLLGAADAAYEATQVAQIAYVQTDFAATRARCTGQLDPDEFGERFRAGGRRTKDEAVAIGIEALEAFVAQTAEASGGRTSTTTADSR